MGSPRPSRCGSPACPRCSRGRADGAASQPVRGRATRTNTGVPISDSFCIFLTRYVLQGGAKLKKTVTIDKSVAPNAGAVLDGGAAKPSSAPAASKPSPGPGGVAGQLSAMMGGGGGAPKVHALLHEAKCSYVLTDDLDSLTGWWLC